jgi:hypothetical protein
MFDDLVLLGTGGVPCYIGPSTHVIDYFASFGYRCPAMENPAGMHNSYYYYYTKIFRVIII